MQDDANILRLQMKARLIKSEGMHYIQYYDADQCKELAFVLVLSMGMRRLETRISVKNRDMKGKEEKNLTSPNVNNINVDFPVFEFGW